MAGRLSAAQTARTQAVATATFDLAGIVIQRPARTFDNYGTYSETLTTLATVAGAWAKPTASEMAQYAGLIGSHRAWIVRLPFGTSVQNGDQLSMPSGDTLTVQADLSKSSYSTCVRVLATEVV